LKKKEEERLYGKSNRVPQKKSKEIELKAVDKYGKKQKIWLKREERQNEPKECNVCTYIPDSL
jgi:hypothetical protein